MDKIIYQKIEKNKNNHWWFKSRRKIFRQILKAINLNNPVVLDYGCGAGANLTLLKKISQNIDAYEPNEEMHSLIQSEYKVNIIKKLKKKYDLIIITDVLEHIENDKSELQNIADHLNKSGYILITVPAYQFLYSSKDELLHHFRRYNKKTLINIFPKEVYVKKISYFNSFLFIPIAIIIIITKILNIQFLDLSEEPPNKFINYLLYKIFSFERYLLSRFNFQFGVSILAILKKK